VRIVVDRKSCLRSGQCTYLHPELFREDADGYPEVIIAEFEDEPTKDAAEDAVEMCPAQAISVE
jgi:ferredoxin